jgi:hypothetical protein
MDQESKSPFDSGSPSEMRRPYRRPRLERYGTLTDITQATMGMNGAADGSVNMGKVLKTS